MRQIIPVAGPSITQKEIDYVLDAVANGWYEKANGYIIKLEESFKAYVGRKYAIALPSCTSGLHLSLLGLDIGAGDEVIVPDATWIASAAPVSYVGATPIFADIDPQTWCLSAETVKPLISKRTKAIIAVNLYGHMPDYERLLNLGVPIIEDAAESIGSKYKGRLAGSFGITSCFSFHGSKTLVTGEGGMLVTDEKEIYDKCMILRDHGRNPGDTLFQNGQIGYKYKMSNLQAALGLAQLERIEELVSKKRGIFLEYETALKNTDVVSLNPAHPDVENSYWMTTALFDKSIGLTKFEIIKTLREQKIETRPFFDPLSSLKAYEASSDRERARNTNKNAYSISLKGVNLPSGAHLSCQDINMVSNIVRNLGV